MIRFGSLIGINKDKVDEYIAYHAKVWPGVMDMIKKCNIRNYSIFFKDGFLFSYFEYDGEDYKKDVQKMADDPETQKWWDLIKPMQIPLATRSEGEWWSTMEEVFHLD